MKEVYKKIYVGTAADYERILEPGKVQYELGCDLSDMAFVITARDPYHRKEVGWTGRGCPKDNPEYLVAYRHGPERIVLNMLDGKSAEWIPDSMVMDALEFALIYRFNGNDSIQKKVMFICNQGHSRGPGLAMAFLKYAAVAPYDLLAYEQAKGQFTSVYPDFLPGTGMDEWLSIHWSTL